MQARNVDIAQLEKLAMMDRGLTGTVDADATINGTTDAPVVNGTVAVSKGGFQNYTYDSLKAKVDFDGKTIGLDATLQQSPTQALTAQGTIPMTAVPAQPGRPRRGERRGPAGSARHLDADRPRHRSRASRLPCRTSPGCSASTSG